MLSISDKLSFIFFGWACAFLLSWHFNSLVILLIVLLRGISRSFKPVSLTASGYFSRFLGYCLLFVVVLVGINGLLVHEGAKIFSLLWFDFYEGGLLYGLTVSTRLIALSLSILLLFVSTGIRDFTDYLRSAGLPNSLVSIILLTLFFLEEIPKRVSRIFTAQEARGAPVRSGLVARSKALFVILSPLVLSSMVESVERGAALELRGYTLHKRNQESSKSDGTLHVWGYIFLTLACFIIIGSFIHWVSN